MRNQNSLMQRIIRIYSKGAVILHTILLFPILQVFYSFIFCSTDQAAMSFYDKCYSGDHLYLAIASIVAVALLLAQEILMALMMIDIDPFSGHTLAEIENSQAFLVILNSFVAPLLSMYQNSVRSQLTPEGFPDRILHHSGHNQLDTQRGPVSEPPEV